jgi:hypothetical protein
VEGASKRRHNVHGKHHVSDRPHGHDDDDDDDELLEAIQVL